MVMLVAFTFWFPLLLLAKAKIHGKSFEPRVEWMCAESAIEVLMHTKEPFYGRIQPKGTNSCSVKGNGDNINRMIIPLDGDGGTQWRDCGLHLENGSSTLWTQLEVHQHPMLILQHDKLINVSCSQWSDSLERHEEADNPYRLVFRPAEPQSMEEMSPVNRLQFGASYKLLLFGPPPQGQLRIHSCNATSIDRSLAVQLIDSDGCSLDPNLLMSAFNSPSQTGGPVPDNSSSQQANSSSATPPPPPSQQHRIAVATARVPSMFRFNTQQQQQTSTATNPLNAVDLVRFECSVEPCGQRGQQPCQPKPDCDSRRVVARQKTVEKEPATEGAAGDLELVTHLLGSGDNETKDDIGAELNTSLTGDIPTKSSTNEPGDSGIISAGGWHRVRTVVRVLEGNSRGSAAHLNAGRTGATNEQQTSAAPPTMSTTISSVEPGTKEEALSPQQRALESGIDPFLSNNSSSSASAAHSAPSPLLRDFSGTSVFPPPPPPSLLPRPSNHTSSSSTCISADQLLRLYQLGVGLCALFLLGCFCNLLLCCLHSRRRNPKSLSPLRSKRGRREHVLISNGPTSQSTLNSSLYGPTGQATQKGAKVGPREEGTGFWISGDGGRENCVDIGEHSMLSSIYGALPVQPQPIAAPLPNNTSNRRSSVHSYASVKAPHSVQHRGGGGHHLLNPRINQQQPQEHELVQRQQVVNLSPTHSPSTTTSSGGNFHLSRTFQPHLPLSQLDMQNQASNSLASSSSVRSSTLGTPSPSETDPTNSSTPRPSSDLLHRQQEDGTSNNQPQSSTFGGANFLTTTTVPSLKGQCQQQQQIESFSIL